MTDLEGLMASSSRSLYLCGHPFWAGVSHEVDVRSWWTLMASSSRSLYLWGHLFVAWIDHDAYDGSWSSWWPFPVWTPILSWSESWGRCRILKVLTAFSSRSLYLWGHLFVARADLDAYKGPWRFWHPPVATALPVRLPICRYSRSWGL